MSASNPVSDVFEHGPDVRGSGGRLAERARKPLPTLIVLDLKLPRLDGRGVEGDPRRRADQAHSGGNPDVVQIVPHLHLDALLAVQPERVTVLR